MVEGDKAGRTRRPPPPRHLAPSGDRDVDRWVNEGLSAFGSYGRTVQAGALAGGALPWLAATLALLYVWVNNLFAPPNLRESLGPARFLQLLSHYGWGLVEASLALAVVGALFAIARRELLRLRIRAPETRFAWLEVLCDSRLAGAAMGWLLYWLWALWPRGDVNYAGALQHVWIWVFFGVLFSMYLHWAHVTFLYRLFYRDWGRGCAAVVDRLLKGNMRVWVPCVVYSNVETGFLKVEGFPQGAGVDRLRDLLRRLPGVESLSVAEVGGADTPSREIMTLHITPTDGAIAANPEMIAAGRLAFALGIASGFIVYLLGLAVIALEGTFFQAANFVVALAIQVEVVGVLLGYALRTLFSRRAQRELPGQLEWALQFAGKDLKGFAYGFTWEEAHVVADVTRAEARAILAPVAARFGVKRLLIEAPLQERTVDTHIPRYGWRGA